MIEYFHFPNTVAQEATAQAAMVVQQIVAVTPTTTLDPTKSPAPTENTTTTQTAMISDQTTTAAPLTTLQATTIPIPTIGPSMGSVIHGGNMRNAPGGTLSGTVCPGDIFTYLYRQGEWFTIHIEHTAADCVPNRVKAGSSGWVHQSLLSTPRSVVQTAP